MRSDLLVGREDREERGGEAGDLAEHRRGLGATGTVGLGAEPVPEEEEGLPPVVVGDGSLIDRDVLKVGKIVPVAEYGVELGPDGGPASLQPGDPVEGVGRQERGGRHERGPEEEPLGRVQESGPGVVGQVDRLVAGGDANGGGHDPKRLPAGGSRHQDGGVRAGAPR